MSRQSIQVAEQGTLEAVLSAVQSIQTQMSAGSTTDHLVWLTDYKLFGEESYVFNNKNKLHELYLDYDLVMNDRMINAEAFDWIVTAAESGQAHVGQALAAIHGMTETGTLRTLGTMSVVCNSNAAMNAIINNMSISISSPINDLFNDINYLNASNIIITNSNSYNKFISNSTIMSYIPYLNGILEICIKNSNALNELLSNDVSKNIIKDDINILNRIVANETAMNIISCSATALYFICSYPYARTAFINSIYRDTYYDSIMTTLTNASSLFTKTTSNYSSYDETYWYNKAGKSQSSRPADECFILSSSVKQYSNFETCLTAIQTDTVLDAFDTSTSYQTHTKNIVCPGGVYLFASSGGNYVKFSAI